MTKRGTPSPSECLGLRGFRACLDARLVPVAPERAFAGLGPRDTPRLTMCRAVYTFAGMQVNRLARDSLALCRREYVVSPKSVHGVLSCSVLVSNLCSPAATTMPIMQPAISATTVVPSAPTYPSIQLRTLTLPLPPRVESARRRRSAVLAPALWVRGALPPVSRQVRRRSAHRPCRVRALTPSPLRKPGT